ncbi:MAG: hypothetical protein HRT88_23995, partial [Lentisphaeraceae bacterium]|nr:hypothetical protein [Lentisphaeraceae bacterium]
MKDWKKSFNLLSETEQLILKIYALGAEAVILQTLTQIVNQLTKSDRALKRNEIKTSCEFLRENEFLQSAKANIYNVEALLLIELLAEVKGDPASQNVYLAMADILDQRSLIHKHKIAIFHLKFFLLNGFPQAEKNFAAYEIKKEDILPDVVLNDSTEAAYSDLFAVEELIPCINELSLRAFCLKMNVEQRRHFEKRFQGLKDNSCVSYLYICRLLELDLPAMKKLAKTRATDKWNLQVRATQALLLGNTKRALDLFAKALSATGDRETASFSSTFDYFYALALGSGKSEAVKLRTFHKSVDNFLHQSVKTIREINYFLTYDQFTDGTADKICKLEEFPVDGIMLLPLIHMNGSSMTKKETIAAAVELKQICLDQGHLFFAKEVESFLVATKVNDDNELKKMQSDFPVPALIDYLVIREPWEDDLDTLEEVM